MLSKDAIISIVVVACFVAYSYGLWGIAQDVKTNDYLRKENTELIVSQKKNLELGTKLANAEQLLKAKQTTITKEVIREIEKPVFRECLNTPDGVLLIERAIDNFSTSGQ